MSIGYREFQINSWGEVLGKMNFQRCVANVINPVIPHIPCLDQWVGAVHFINDAFSWPDLPDFQRRPVDDLSQDVDTPRLILVLESPHIDEFLWDRENKEWKPNGPANGSTGVNIRIRLVDQPKKVTNLSDKSKLNLVLVNAVQYQCSLGKSLQTKEGKLIRDEVFQECWEAGKGQRNFKDRLAKYYLPGSIVINCCTQSVNKRNGGRKKQVTNAIEEVVQETGVSTDAAVFELSHPSNWHYRKL